MMIKKGKISYLIGITLFTVFIQTSCTSVASPVASPVSTTTMLTSPNPVVPTETVVALPSVTDTPTPVSTATQAPTEMPSPTLQLTPQVNPGMNAYCRKGPGTDYFSVTFLQAGNNYNVVGQDGLETWWLVQGPGNVTCWVGDPTSVIQGFSDSGPCHHGSASPFFSLFICKYLPL